MKYATIIKTGYSAGIYGNSGEYFTCIFTGKNGMSYFKFESQYGGEQRIAHLLEERGYKVDYSAGNYGKIAKKDIHKVGTYNEYVVEKNIDELLKHGYIE